MKIHLLMVLCVTLVGTVIYAQNGNPEMMKLTWISGCWKGDGKIQIEEQWTKGEEKGKPKRVEFAMKRVKCD